MKLSEFQAPAALSAGGRTIGSSRSPGRFRSRSLRKRITFPYVGNQIADRAARNLITIMTELPPVYDFKDLRNTKLIA